MKNVTYYFTVLFLLLVSCNTPKTFPTFEAFKIDSIGSHLRQTDLVDIENDG